MTHSRANLTLAVIAGALLALPGCGAKENDGPPDMTLGVSVCVHCDMIISDERFASATVIRDERGDATALLFDDVGDQIRYEKKHPDMEILDRWVHDHETAEWVRADEAFFMHSDDLHTPMASGIAAFAARADAEAMAQELSGRVLSREELWRERR